MDEYVSCLVKEIGQYSGPPIDTLYFGGGTPTVLSPAQIESIFQGIHRHFDTRNLAEVTVEANPESATESTLAALRSAGVNRVSFGLQATQDRLLKRLDRLHTWEMFLEAWHRARKAGFDNISVDLMYGLPGQSMDDWKESLSRVVDLSPEHMSIYALKIEPDSRFGRENMEVESDLQADMYLHASESLTGQGYNHYEISSLARPGRACRHNLKYWKNHKTIGVGVSAASFDGESRKTNTGDLDTYLETLHASRSPIKEEVRLEAKSREKETAMLALRLSEGIPRDTLEKLNIPVAQTFLEKGLATQTNTNYTLTPPGWLLSNPLFQHLI